MSWVLGPWVMAAKCRFPGICSRFPEQFCRLLDRLSDCFAIQCLQHYVLYPEREPEVKPEEDAEALGLGGVPYRSHDDAGEKSC